MEGTKAGGQTKRTGTLTEREKKIRTSNEHAYSLEEVAEMLDKLPEPARTVCSVAAFAVLTRSELRGLKWSDYDGESIKGERKIWNQHIGAPKTEARESGVFVIPLLREILADVSTTQALYILPNRKRAEAGLKKLDKTLRTKYGIKA